MKLWLIQLVMILSKLKPMHLTRIGHLMSKKFQTLSLVPIYHENWGYIVLLVNGREYSYHCDNAIILRFRQSLRKKSINKGKLFAWFKRKSILVSGSNFEQL